MKAYGMVETYGFIASIEAADVMLKVADVTLVKSEKVRGGLVMVSIAGDVGAVKTAVEAGASAVKRLGEDLFYGSHVIPRPDGQLVKFCNVVIPSQQEMTQEEAPIVPLEESPVLAPQEVSDMIEEIVAPTVQEDEHILEQSLLKEMPTADASETASPQSLEALQDIVTDQEPPKETAPVAVPQAKEGTAKEFKRQLEKTKAADLRQMIAKNERLSIPEKELKNLVRREMIALLVDDFKDQRQQKKE